MDVPNDIDAVQFLDLLESLGLEQHVTEATHIFGRTLDLVITRCVCKCNLTETLLGSTPRSFRYLSDHSAVRCSIRINKPAPQAKRVTYRNTKGAFLWHDPHQDQWPEITRIMVDQMNRRILVQSGFIVHLIYHVPDHPKGTHPKSVDLDCLKQDIAKSDLCLQGCVGCPCILLKRFWQVCTKLQLHPKQYTRSSCTPEIKSSGVKAPGPLLQPRICRGEKKSDARLSERWERQSPLKTCWCSRVCEITLLTYVTRHGERFMCAL